MSLNQICNGIILIDKEAGMTSFCIDGKIKRMLGTKKVGHLGTLDPFATGLLPICVGDALRIIRYTDDYCKGYQCVARFGYCTDTMDTEGQEIFGRRPTKDELDELVRTDFKSVRSVFVEISTHTTQIPPIYSAKKINGRKAYELAREGKEIELKPQAIKIFKLEISSITINEDTFDVDFEVLCSKGTYIRVICDELGRRLEFGAHAIKLRRLVSGPFEVAKANTINEIESKIACGDMSFLIDEENAIEYMPVLEVNRIEASDIRLGKKILADRFVESLAKEEAGTRFRARCEGALIAIVYDSYEEAGHVLRIERMLAK